MQIGIAYAIMRLKMASAMPLLIQPKKGKILNHIKRFFKEPTQSFFLLGPRGTGKSTLVKKRYPDALWLDLLNPETLRSLSALPERLFNLVHAYPEKN